MHILVITTYFQPDSAIAAVRPYQLAKYLVKAGHDVTVLRSGKIYSKPVQGFRQEDESFRVISFLGNDSDAERYRRGEFIEKNTVRTYSNVPVSIRKRLAKVYHILKEPFESGKHIRKAQKDFALQKKILDTLKDEGEKFDLVFSTYSKLENVFAGEYAANLFRAKWIMDFRDPIVQKNGGTNYIWNLCTKKIQIHALQTANLSTTVSEDYKRELQKFCPHARVETLYNGYDPSEIMTTNVKTKIGPLVICYTGTVYRYRQAALEGFLDFLSELLHGKKIEKQNIRFIYAGPNSEVVKSVFKERNILEILEDRGFVSRDEAQLIQNSSDLFLVLSWNTKTSRGALTGKFYEGIRAGKPILTVIAGDVVKSELYTLNEKYNYGFCYELCRREVQTQILNDFFSGVYLQKITKGVIDYHPSDDLKNAFRYDRITEKLLELADSNEVLTLKQ